MPFLCNSEKVMSATAVVPKLRAAHVHPCWLRRTSEPTESEVAADEGPRRTHPSWGAFSSGIAALGFANLSLASASDPEGLLGPCPRPRKWGRRPLASPKPQLIPLGTAQTGCTRGRLGRQPSPRP